MHKFQGLETEEKAQQCKKINKNASFEEANLMSKANLCAQNLQLK